MSTAPSLFHDAVVGTLPVTVTEVSARASCPACRTPKLMARKGWPCVVWCFGCGGNFDPATRTQICPVEGPAALTRRGVIVLPFVPDPARSRPNLHTSNAARGEPRE